MKKLLLCIGVVSIILLIMIIGLTLFRNSFFGDANEGRSNEELLQVITEEFPNFTANDKPTIKIESVSRYEDNWYVVTIKSLEQIDNFVPVKVLLYDEQNSGNNLLVMIGPDVHFSKYQTLRYDLPDSVIIDLEEQ